MSVTMELLEVDYGGEFKVLLLKCCWYQKEKDLYGFTRVNFNRPYQKFDPYVMASQVQQIFYVEDPIEKMMYNVVKKGPRDWCDVEIDVTNESQGHKDPFVHAIHIVPEVENQVMESSWCWEEPKILLNYARTSFHG